MISFFTIKSKLIWDIGQLIRVNRSSDDRLFRGRVVDGKRALGYLFTHVFSCSLCTYIWVNRGRRERANSANSPSPGYYYSSSAEMQPSNREWVQSWELCHTQTVERMVELLIWRSLNRSSFQCNGSSRSAQLS